jgi:hypothetical protein
VIDVDLRMLRYQSQYAREKPASWRQTIRLSSKAGHTATSTLGVDRSRITLLQQFREADFYDSSAVAVAVVGRDSRARYLNQADVQVSAAQGRGRFMILIASAASAG